jgi:hypothetical protein
VWNLRFHAIADDRYGPNTAAVSEFLISEVMPATETKVQAVVASRLDPRWSAITERQEADLLGAARRASMGVVVRRAYADGYVVAASSVNVGMNEQDLFFAYRPDGLVRAFAQAAGLAAAAIALGTVIPSELAGEIRRPWRTTKGLGVPDKPEAHSPVDVRTLNDAYRIGAWLVGSPDKSRAWERQVAAFKESRHLERRDSDGEPTSHEWSQPEARPSERLVLNIYGSHFLFEVTNPPAYGYRLVNLVVAGVALVWEMPGYSRGEAERISTLLVDEYL